MKLLLLLNAAERLSRSKVVVGDGAQFVMPFNGRSRLLQSCSRVSRTVCAAPPTTSFAPCLDIDEPHFTVGRLFLLLVDNYSKAKKDGEYL